jgi:cyclopropane-fatty-acyl-phospholipid synthase
LKYSCGFWQELEWYYNPEAPSKSFYRDVITGTSSMCKEFEKGKSIRQLLTKSEENMLKIVMARMDMKDGYNVLDIGCGWGSATFFMLERYPKSKIVSVSNSNRQRELIIKKAKEKGVSDRLLVFTCNVNEFSAKNYASQIEKFLGTSRFDRLHSCEMFEHMRNWEKLLNMFREDWVKEDGGMFLHVFTHETQAYPYDERTWMGKNFFMGGIMPSHDLLSKLDQTIGKSWELSESWKVNGRHYARTSEAWLKLLDQEQKKIRKALDDEYKDPDLGKLWFYRWRMFYIAVAEFFAIREGTEWYVSHYYMKPIKK